MANKKFSDFTNQPSSANTFLVGYDGATNVRIPVTDSLFQGGVNKYVIELDGSLSNVTFSTAGGKTFIDVTHNLNNSDIVPQIYLNDGGGDEIYYTTIYIQTPNTLRIESAQGMASGTFKLLILY